MNRVPTPRVRVRAARVAAVLSLALFAGVTGCDTLTDAAPLDPQFSTAGTADLNRIAVYKSGAPQLTVAWAMAWIGPAGGSVRILDFEVVVPQGALSKTTRIAIRLPVDPWAAEHAVAQFEPHGIQFAKPVTLRLPYAGTSADGTNASIMWWNGSAWVKFASVVLPDGRIETTTTHFSEYGTEEPSRGITPLGG